MGSRRAGVNRIEFKTRGIGLRVPPAECSPKNGTRGSRYGYELSASRPTRPSAKVRRLDPAEGVIELFGGEKLLELSDAFEFRAFVIILVQAELLVGFVGLFDPFASGPAQFVLREGAGVFGEIDFVVAFVGFGAGGKGQFA